MSLDICGPFSKGTKCQLNAIKTCGLGAALVTILFFTCSAAKFCVVHPDEKKTDSLTLKSTYFLKNVTKKLEDVFVASKDTVITASKKPLAEIQSFSNDEIESFLRKVNEEEFDFGPPPVKRARTEENASSSTLSSTISLSKFLSSPHNQTKNLLVEMTVCGNYIPVYENSPVGVGYLKLIVGDTGENNIMKALFVYCSVTMESENILNSETFKRGSVVQVKGEYLRSKAFGTPKSDNFSERLKRPNVDPSNTYKKAMEDAIVNYRGAAEKTFQFTKPGEDFKKEENEAIECSNLRLTAPLQVDLKAINNFKKIKQLTWTQFSNFLENFAEIERGIKVDTKLSTDCILFTVLEISSKIESSGVVLIKNQNKKAIFFIPDTENRRVNIPIEENSTYIGIILQKSKDENLDENHEKSTTIRLEWIERVDEPYLEDMCDLDA